MKKLFYFLMLLPLVACGEKEPISDVEKPKGATLELTSAEVMEFDAEGGKGAITFDYDGNSLNTNGNSEPTTGRVLTIECEADWISVAREVDVLASAINFEVVANDTDQSREATIKASIKDLSIEVLVKQAAAANGGNDEPKEDPEFVEGWAINGTMNDWVKSEAAAMTEEGDFFVVKGFELTAEDNFNFILNGNEKSIGGNGRTSEPDFVYEAMSWGSNISVAEAGVYDIYLSTDLKYYYIMTEGQNPADAEEPLKPGDKRWSLFGSFEGNNRVEDIPFVADGKYLAVKGVKFVDDKTFVVRCNDGEAVLGVASDKTFALEEAINLVEKSGEGYDIKVDVEADVKYDIYFIYAEEASQLWVMPEGSYPVVWNRVQGAYMPTYNNFLLYLITSDVVLTLDFKAGNESVVNYVIPEGTYYMNDTEGTGWCFDMGYCIAKVRGHESPLLDGSMIIEHKDGMYDIYVDMRTATLEVLKMHYVGEIGYDPFFTNMGGQKLNNPEK